MGEITIVNCSTDFVQCQVSNKTGGLATWHTLKPGDKNFWERHGWENVIVKSGNRQSNLWVNRGYPATVIFLGFDKDLIVHNENPPPGAFTVRNMTSTVVWACISGGAWEKLVSGANYK